jgi:hypothetical protein
LSETETDDDVGEHLEAMRRALRQLAHARRNGITAGLVPTQDAA